MRTTNFRELKKVYMVEVCEGEGTEESPNRIVRYFYDDEKDVAFLCKHDPVENKNIGV